MRVKRSSRLAALVAGVALAGCAAHSGASGPSAPPVPLETGRVLEAVQSVSDPEQSYAAFVPTDDGPAQRRPVLFVLDPRGRGALGARLFEAAARRHGWIVLSSNGTRSDGEWEPNVRAVKAMLADADARFAIDPRRLYLAGFSGTARGAWALALGMKPNVVGVIAASGGAPAESPPERGLPFAVYATTGIRDFNCLEIRALDARLDSVGAAHRLAVFDGAHEWPPPEVAGEAIGWLELRAMRRGLAPPDERLASELHDRWVAAARAAEREGAIVDAVQRWREMERDFAGTATAAEAHAEAERLATLAGYSAQLAGAERAAAWEQASRSEVERRVSVLASTGPIDEDGALSRVRALHHALRATVASPADPALAGAAQRAIEHLFSFVAFYTPRELLARHAYTRAARVLELALTIRSGDAAVWYNLACARARSGDPQAALDALDQALARGFADRALLESDDDLRSLRASTRYRELLGRWPAPPAPREPDR